MLLKSKKPLIRYNTKYIRHTNYRIPDPSTTIQESINENPVDQNANNEGNILVFFRLLPPIFICNIILSLPIFLAIGDQDALIQKIDSLQEKLGHLQQDIEKYLNDEEISDRVVGGGSEEI